MSESSERKVPKRYTHVNRFCSDVHVAQPVCSRNSYYPMESLLSFKALPVANRFTQAHERYGLRTTTKNAKMLLYSIHIYVM